MQIGLAASPADASAVVEKSGLEAARRSRAVHFPHRLCRVRSLQALTVCQPGIPLSPRVGTVAYYLPRRQTQTSYSGQPVCTFRTIRERYCTVQGAERPDSARTSTLNSPSLRLADPSLRLADPSRGHCGSSLGHADMPDLRVFQLFADSPSNRPIDLFDGRLEILRLWVTLRLFDVISRTRTGHFGKNWPDPIVF